MVRDRVQGFQPSPSSSSVKPTQSVCGTAAAATHAPLTVSTQQYGQYRFEVLTGRMQRVLPRYPRRFVGLVKEEEEGERVELKC